jgi:hypothetical protein
MKQLLFFIAIYPVTVLAQPSQTCDVNNYSPKWVASQDFRTYYGPHEKYRTKNFNEAKMRPHLQVALNWVKQQAANVKGSKEVRYYNNFMWGFPNPELLPTDFWYQATGLISNYYLRFINNGLYCNGNRLITLNGPANIYVSFNYFRHFVRPISKAVDGSADIPVRINGKPVFEAPIPKRSEGRVDHYEYPGPPTEDVANFSKWEFINSYIIRNSDKPLLIPFTRKEYLEQYLVEMQDYYKRIRQMRLQYTQVKSPEEIDKELQARIAEIKKLTEQGAWGYSKESMAHRIKTAEEHYRNLKEEEANKIKNLTRQADENYTESVRLIKEYLQKQPAAILAGPVHYTNGHRLVNAEFETSTVQKLLNELVYEKHAKQLWTWGSTKQLAYFNKDYLNYNLPPDVPQFIAVEFVNLDGVHKNLNEIVNNINRNYDFSALKALLTDKAQPTVVPLQTVAASGGNKFLPKLGKLPHPGITLAPVKDFQGNNVFATMPSPGFNKGKVKINFPAASPLLQKIPALVSVADYSNYLTSLHQNIVNAMPAGGQQSLNNYISKNKLSSSEQLSRNAIGAWLSGYPSAALHFDNKAVLSNAGDGLSANNFAVHLIKSGYPEKALPILNYWLKKYPKNSLLLGNAANAYYYLGDLSRAMQLAQQCVAVDSLHPAANKLLAFGHYKSGNKKLCKGFLERSIKGGYDEETISLLLEIDPDANISKLLYEGRKHGKEPLLLDQFKLPEAINSIAVAEKQGETIQEVKESLNQTIAGISSKSKSTDLEALFNKQFEQMMKSKSISRIQIIAQAIVIESWKKYWKDYGEEMQHLEQKLKQESKNYSSISSAIAKKYDDQIAKLQTGEGEDPRVAQLEKSKCQELNKALDNYLKATAPLINRFAARLEFISREHYTTVANWMPHWLQSEEAADFPGTQSSYLKDMRNILRLYPLLTPMDCSFFESQMNPVSGKLMVWEETFCPFKANIGLGIMKLGIGCTSITIGGGEGLVAEAEFKFSHDWSRVEEVTVAAGIGAQWNLGAKDFGVEAGMSSKMFISFDVDKNNELTFKDIGNKSEITLSGNTGSSQQEIKIAEVTLGLHSGISSDGLISRLPVLR